MFFEPVEKYRLPLKKIYTNFRKSFTPQERHHSSNTKSRALAEG